MPQDEHSGQLAAVDVDGVSRQSFILSGALAAGAAFGLGAIGPFVSNALGASADVEILDFALTLEYLQASLYTVKARAVGLSGAAAGYARTFGREETQHVAELSRAIRSLGGTPAAVPSFDFPAADAGAFLALAYTLENVVVAAYNGAIPHVRSGTVLASAAAIVQVEARHAATIGVLSAKAVTPDGAFDRPITRSQALAATAPLARRLSAG